MAPSPDAKHNALRWIDDNRGWLSDFHRRIWEYAEPAFREYLSAQAYVEILTEAGFDVTAGSGGMPTAFAASWGDGGPVLGTFAEYDAVLPAPLDPGRAASFTQSE